ncbi:MAG: hypothetical protein RL748_511 [Pseudomonadota bacterium]
MNPILQNWQRLSGVAKTAAIIAVLCIFGLAAALGWWAYRTDYGLLFADLSNADAAAMVAELDRMKTPYQLTDGGRTILVPKDLVYKTRLKVMGKELPLHGAVGFEVFNNADFGMTEFVQKVNYQRAVQGELTRTILAIEDVQAARVHLAIPEQGLFKKALSKPKASVTLTLKPGRVLAPEQIGGIQRLVAASVPEIQIADVTVLDQHGVPLSRVASNDGSIESAMTQLDSKRGVEDYLLKKVNQVLDNTFGPGAAIASVDVALNLDQDRTTTEDVLPAKGAPDATPAGVLVRERQTTHMAASNNASATSLAGSGENSSVESDYQVGRRVQQVVTAPGSVKRMTIAVVVKKSLEPAQLEHLKEVVSLALGFNAQRGDAIVIQSMDKLFGAGNAANAANAANLDANPSGPAKPALQLTPSAQLSLPAKPAAENLGETARSASHAGAARTSKTSDDRMLLWILLSLLAVPVLMSWFWWLGQRRQQSASLGPAMNQSERDQLLQQVRQWIQQGAVDDAIRSRK